MVSVPRLKGILGKKGCFGMPATHYYTFSNFMEHRQEKIGKYFLPEFIWYHNIEKSAHVQVGDWWVMNSWKQTKSSAMVFYNYIPDHVWVGSVLMILQFRLTFSFGWELQQRALWTLFPNINNFYFSFQGAGFATFGQAKPVVTPFGQVAAVGVSSNPFMVSCCMSESCSMTSVWSKKNSL